MADKSGRSDIHAEFTWGKSSRPLRAQPDAPLHLLVMGDFHGAAQPGGSARPVRVDIDTFAGFLQKTAPRTLVALPGTSPIDVTIHDLDDFHPDHLFVSLPCFAELRRLREMLGNPATFAQAAAQLGMAARQASAASAGPSPASEQDDDALARLLGRASSVKAAAQDAQGGGGINDLIRTWVGPYVVAGVDPRRDDAIAAVDRAAQELMRAVLRHPAFRALEAIWRGLDYLVRAIDADAGVHIEVLDLTRADLEADLQRGAMQDTLLHRVVVEQRSGPSGSPPFALIVGHYEFAPRAADAAVLQRMGSIASAGGAAFVAAGELAGFTDAETAPGERDAWRSLRRHPDATSVALCAPGFLLRLPYGKGMEETERFRFEEVSVPPEPSALLWGNSALLVAAVLAGAYLQSGAAALDDGAEISGLPVYWYKQDGETIQMPCAESWLSVAQAEQLLSQGLLAWSAVRGRDAVRAMRFLSLAEPSQALAGRWR